MQFETALIATASLGVAAIVGGLSYKTTHNYYEPAPVISHYQLMATGKDACSDKFRFELQNIGGRRLMVNGKPAPGVITHKHFSAIFKHEGLEYEITGRFLPEFQGTWRNEINCTGRIDQVI